MLEHGQRCALQPTNIWQGSSQCQKGGGGLSRCAEGSLLTLVCRSVWCTLLVLRCIFDLEELHLGFARAGALTHTAGSGIASLRCKERLGR
jgi:hypothetical protein